jgi:MFS family permease
MDAARDRRTIFYGWWIVAAAFTINAFAWSTRASFAVVYDAMLKDLGWSRAEAVLGYAISWLVLAAFAPLTGWLYDRAGPRVVVPAGGCALAAGLLATSRATAAWQYDLSYGVLVGFGIAATLSPGNALVSRWFVRRRGTALASSLPARRWAHSSRCRWSLGRSRLSAGERPSCGTALCY